MHWGLFIVSLMGVLHTVMTGISGENVARKGHANQSSTHYSGGSKPGYIGVPERAIDGNRASYFQNHSCTHTKASVRSWWRVDLLKTYKVNNVTITNRKDCCPERINGAEIRIGNSLSDNGNRNPRCTVISDIDAGASRTFQCKGMKGRFVNIVIPKKNGIVTLCEVEVYGDIAATDSPLVLIKKKKTWGEALDYCREYHYDLVSIHHVDTQALAVLEAMQPSNTPYVWLGLHYTCTLDFWFWVSGESSFYYTNWAPGNGTGGEECGMTGAMERDGENRWVARSDTERLNFVCEEDLQEPDPL